MREFQTKFFKSLRASAATILKPAHFDPLMRYDHPLFAKTVHFGLDPSRASTGPWSTNLVIFSYVVTFGKCSIRQLFRRGSIQLIISPFTTKDKHRIQLICSVITRSI